MQTVGDISKNLDLKPGTRGRKDCDGLEEVIKIKPIKDAVKELMHRFQKAKGARAEYNEALKAVAERSGTNSKNLNALIKASASGKFADVRRDVDQQGVLFEQVGEVSAEGADDEK